MDVGNIVEKAEELGVEKGYVDVVKMARDLGVGVLGVQDEDDFNAHIIYDTKDDVFKLYVNQNHTVERQRFSIAHELAHFILHPEKVKELGKMERHGNTEMEKAADQLAADILIPELLLKGHLESDNIDAKDIDKRAIISIANKFKVSKGMAILRLRELGYYVPFIQFS